MIILNALIIISAVSVYSPGLLALYPNDPSVFKAGMSILIGIFLFVIFIYGNFSLLSDKRQKIEISDLAQAKKILYMYSDSRNFGSIAKTILNQLERLERSMSRLQYEIDRKFAKNSISNDKYSAVINEANASLVDNLINTTHKMQFFYDDEYARLLECKNDNIPDEIQLKQLELYKANEDAIQEVIEKNEKLILQLDTLAIELSRPGEQDDDILEEIQQLTREVRYYK